MLEERRRCMCIPWVALQRSPSLKRESSHDQIYLNAFISPGIMYLCGSITSLAVFVTCYDFSTGSERYHNKKDQHNHKDSQSCDNQWASINPSHTMCLKDVGTGISLTETFRHTLVHQHNDIRSHVQPHAADMTKLTWDDDLALVAEKWAKQCKTYSDKPLNRQVPSMPGVQIGQNTAYYYKDFKDAVDAWAEEKKHLRFKVGFYGGAAANYSQMVLSKAQRVGCGMASCPNQPFTHLYVCNYALQSGE
ncbi:cysteine-rich venom protein Mr30-like isoform X1 [Pomacea canaliculata]|uniref:cysteine-rich venom protein Mr30-like isoform X1 n=2 Tax=Pomacea canaliculata TaxID=400727 RepID=UPI000D73CE8E|nr:cysteine-rich venom protein Mr30-like isoform X1 [Pomacea canaliculata]XP_025095111.1 cysteine-rich venom protein Mr30-like isoform X1 [Pomacea canaliculata]